jgi:hypothetical protein
MLKGPGKRIILNARHGIRDDDDNNIFGTRTFCKAF